MTVLESVLKGLMDRYKERVPDVSKITQALINNNVISSEKNIKNDHIAFRTMGVPQLGIASFEKIFIHYGYTPKDDYFFENKKINARWYAPPEDHLPRIFLSELRINDFSKDIQNTIQSYTNEVTTDPVDNLDLNDAAQVDHFLHNALWRRPSWSDYQKLQNVSEYAAWVIYNRYYLNHYTINVTNLPKGYNTLDAFNIFLKSIDITLSNAGGIIKKSKDGLLLQSSTISQLCEATFSDNDTHLIPGSYVEFAERKILPEYTHLSLDDIKRQHRRDGFETSNADKIFESTFTSQTKRKSN